MSRPQTRSQSRSKVPEPVIELLSDDDESENDGVGAISEDAKTGSKTSKLELDVLTIGIGKAVHSSSCRITFDTREDKYELSFVRAPKKGRETRSSYFSWSSNADVIRRSIHVDDLLEVKFHAVGRGNGAIPCDDDDESADDSQQQMSFLAMRIDIEGESDFRLELRDLAPTSKQDKLKYVVVEFRNDNDLKQCIHHLRGSKEWRAMLENGELDETDCYIYSTALIEHYKSEVKSRRSALASPSLKHRDDDFVRSRNADDILLVYPFNGDAAEIEKAAEGLTEARGLDVPEDAGLNVVSDADADDPAKFSGRGHYMTIRVADYERLEPGEYLNDTLIDFWMQWYDANGYSSSVHLVIGEVLKHLRFVLTSRIARRADRSKIHIFSSHFYSTLKKNSPEDIAKWTKNKGINVFEKQLVFIPVNQTLHWSLCVIVNPGAIANGHKVGAPEDLWPGIFFFDSLKAHQKGQVTKDVRKWLNTECKRLFDSDQSTLPADMASLLTNDERAYETEWRSFPFTSKTMKCSSPKGASLNHCLSELLCCAMCLTSFAVPYQNNGSDCGVFVCRYAYSMYELTRRAPITFAFTPGHLTASDEFSFNTGDIARIREEVKTLIRRLTKVYAPWKETELQREKEENAERKVAPRHEATKPKGNSDPDSPDDQGGELEKHSSKELCSDLATTETSTATAMSNDVKIDSPLSPGGEPSVESHDRATSAALNAACNSLILNDVSARKPPSPSSVPGDESLNAACGFVRLGDLGSNTPLSPSSLQADVHGGVSNETSLVSSAIVSEGADLSNLRCLRHPGDPGFPEANASSAVHSIGKGLSHVSPQKETEIRDATSGDSGTVDPSMVLKDVENKTTRSMEPQKAQPSLRCLSEENLNAVASPIVGPSALQYGSGNSECIHSSAKGSRDRDDHLAGGCTTLHIASSSSSECTQQIEEDSGQDDTPDCEMEAATVGDDEVDAPEDLFPFSSAFEPMKRIGSVERGVALLTTNDDSRMDTSN
jgi:Ulp1 protease family, C-terminal catalytic domain